MATKQIEPKLTTLKKRYAAGDFIGALRIAAKFPDLGDHKAIITRGWAAIQSPEFYQEMGHDPDALAAAAFAALKDRYSL